MSNRWCAVVVAVVKTIHTYTRNNGFVDDDDDVTKLFHVLWSGIISWWVEISYIEKNTFCTATKFVLAANYYTHTYIHPSIYAYMPNRNPHKASNLHCCMMLVQFSFCCWCCCCCVVHAFMLQAASMNTNVTKHSWNILSAFK